MAETMEFWSPKKREEVLNQEAQQEDRRKTKNSKLTWRTKKGRARTKLGGSETEHRGGRGVRGPPTGETERPVPRNPSQNRTKQKKQGKQHSSFNNIGLSPFPKMRPPSLKKNQKVGREQSKKGGGKEGGRAGEDMVVLKESWNVQPARRVGGHRG